jgi:hypothetical protein
MAGFFLGSSKIAIDSGASSTRSWSVGIAFGDPPTR